jgi:hypothetical protein
VPIPLVAVFFAGLYSIAIPKCIVQDGKELWVKELFTERLNAADPYSIFIDTAICQT